MRIGRGFKLQSTIRNTRHGGHVRTTLMVQGVLVSLGLVVAGLWGWQQAQEIVLDHWLAGRPELAAWAVRIVAVAAVALAQVILIAFVAGRTYRRGVIDSALAVTAGAVFVLSVVGAIACGIAAR